jgi:uncharacterized membrane protein (GlpM family)
VLQVVFKALLGGTMVVVFALISELFEPKSFSGIFSTAPSVALGSLGVSLLAGSGHEIATACEGMFLGAIALLCYCLVASPAVQRLGIGRGAGLALAAWFIVALPGVIIWGLR